MLASIFTDKFPLRPKSNHASVLSGRDDKGRWVQTNAVVVVLTQAVVNATGLRSHQPCEHGQRLSSSRANSWRVLRRWTRLCYRLNRDAEADTKLQMLNSAPIFFNPAGKVSVVTIKSRYILQDIWRSTTAEADEPGIKKALETMGWPCSVRLGNATCLRYSPNTPRWNVGFAYASGVWCCYFYLKVDSAFPWSHARCITSRLVTSSSYVS